MAAFSRLQLAAALLEYDNDLSDPDAPNRSAHESAIFAHLRRRPPPVRKSDYLGVSLPSETGSLGGRESGLDQRRSRGSIEALRNPFGADTVEGYEEDEKGENEMEVDLTSWGLDAFIPKEKESKHGRNKSNAKMETLPNPHPVSLRRPDGTGLQAASQRAAGARSMSMGNLDQFGAGGAFLETRPTIDDKRRRSLASPLDLDRMAQPHMPRQRRRASSHVLIETLPAALPLHSVPFPSGSGSASSPPHFNENDLSGLRPLSGTAQLNPHPTHERTYSSATMGSRVLVNEEESNPFSLRPPSPERASRFDPKSNRPRTASNATMAASAALLAENDNPFSLRPPSRASRFDPKVAAHVRTVSNASIGSHMLLDNDLGSVLTGQGSTARERPYSTFELLRPKILVMPSPLQAVTPTVQLQPAKPRAGFQLSADGPPLPPGARSNRRSSVALSVVEPSPVPIASNSFTPNPRINLSLSQLTFRNTLMVGGQRDVAYSDIDGVLPRATEDGEQIRPESPKEELPVLEPVVVEEEPLETGRRAGKLFGKSLIDDLEERKAHIRSKQRVFTGDERPSMMARGDVQRSSRLIDPASLQSRPTSQHLNSFGSSHSQQALGRRTSSNVKPLLNFDDDTRFTPANLNPGPKMPNSRSVFGVDTLWEREMAKLREIEALEKREAEEASKRETAAESQRIKKGGRGKGKSKGKGKKNLQGSTHPTEPTAQQIVRTSEEPPVLPIIQKAVVRRPPAEDDASESDDSVIETQPMASQGGIGPPAERWYSDSSEGDNAPRRTTGKGPRYPNVGRGQQADEDSEEDIPLAATVGRAVQRATRLEYSRADSDEEKPLSALLEKTKLSLPSINFDRTPREADDDDDQPLGLRASKVITSPLALNREDDDDDRPLAFHPEQQRRTQYQMMAQQQQQQQQQMMMQASSNMFFGAPPSMMGSGFFAPSIQMPVMMAPPPPPMPSPPPVHDAAKYGRVDRWRRDVAVEEEP